MNVITTSLNQNEKRYVMAWACRVGPRWNVTLTDGKTVRDYVADFGKVEDIAEFGTLVLQARPTDGMVHCQVVLSEPKSRPYGTSFSFGNDELLAALTSILDGTFSAAPEAVADVDDDDDNWED